MPLRRVSRVLRALLAGLVIASQVFASSTSIWPPAASAQAATHSLLLNGSPAAAEAAANPDLNLTADWTVELWLKDGDPNRFDHTYRYLVNKGDGVAAESPFYVLLAMCWLACGRAASITR